MLRIWIFRLLGSWSRTTAGIGSTKIYTSMTIAQAPCTMPQYSDLAHRVDKGAPASGSQVSPMWAAQNIDSMMIPVQYVTPVKTIPRYMEILMPFFTWKISKYRRKIASLLKKMVGPRNMP